MLGFRCIVKGGTVMSNSTYCIFSDNCIVELKAISSTSRYNWPICIEMSSWLCCDQLSEQAFTIGGQKFGTSCFGNILAGLLKRVKNALSNWRRLGLTMDRLSLEIGITKMGAKTCVLWTCVCVCARVRVCVWVTACEKERERGRVN